MSKISEKIKKDSGTQVRDAAFRIAQGRVLSVRFFRRYMFQTIFVVALIMIYIANRYDCVTGMETITRLRTETEIVKTQLQSERSSYMTSVREKTIQQKADSLGLHLSIQQQPPYHLQYDPR